MGWLRDPLAQRRWRRFRQRRRAFASLVLLAALCALGLCAELLCNDRPLAMRWHGRFFFPFLRAYPPGYFQVTGVHEQPCHSFRELARTRAFAAGTGNGMLFAPIPYGPRESLDPAELAHERRLLLRFAPAPRVGTINVDGRLRVARSAACGYFFGTRDAAVDGLALEDGWPVDDRLRAAVSNRLRNAAAPAFAAEAASRRDPAVRATLRLPAFEPRSAAPATVRITLEERSQEGAATTVAFTPQSEPLAPVPPLWSRIAAPDRATLLEGLRVRVETGAGTPMEVTADGARYRVTPEVDEVRWPYPPVRGHWMGIDAAGRDVLARVLYGLRTSMAFGLVLVLAAMVLGSLVGAVQGFFGGAVDIAGQRLIEIWSALPFLYVMILMGSVFGQGFAILLVCYGLFNWIGVSYYVRAEFLRLRQQPFVEAARCMGIPTWKIMARHVMPNALTPLITLFPFLLVGAIGSLAALDYLGFGLPPLTPSWGELLHQAQQFRWAWWLILYPSLALFTVMLLGVFIGEGVRDAYDPRPVTKLE